ncbi:RraA family protein [Sutcliffiella rhizosphaerae]|uniref:Putative 4-hydroxy-4-methyl-2-oxoglutarate aldolase n=1 Tax=Sutcliffiella rhizosphaerae TaxID=2880967 RepID=A0ABM8YMM3_9BACI|nr:RraA family protein [Sutcliffiella rhizosphaerae]CAG9621226.1 4-carboxy-4-hydroxy-2-oxoadipate aldolase [Sutcliffiella rhizosphaerae]
MTTVEIKKTPEILPQEWIKRAKKLSTTLISDAMDTKIEMHHLIKPCNMESVLVGSAVTIDVKDGDNLAVHHAIYNSQPGHVLVVDPNGYEKKAVIGELMVAAAAALQLNGFIIDGLIRDYHTLSSSTFPVFSRGAIPGGPTKNGPGIINEAITCGGLTVLPGDFVMGDADGVIVVPRDKVESALKKAEEKAEYEANRLKSIAEGNIKPTWLK